MAIRGPIGALLLVAFAGCARQPQAPARVELRRISGDTIQLVPTEGQLPYCLAFTHSQHGVTRQLTISKTNVSVQCPVGQPVLGQSYRVPVEEGKVHVFVLLSDQRLQAASVVDQITEMDKPSFTPMDLRLPGRVIVETIDFTPVAGGQPTTGELVGGVDAGIGRSDRASLPVQ
jgi:hypothetical protein